MLVVNGFRERGGELGRLDYDIIVQHRQMLLLQFFTLTLQLCCPTFTMVCCSQCAHPRLARRKRRNTETRFSCRH